MNQENPPKVKVAFFDFTSCEGCQLTVLDSLQTHPELLDVVEIVEFREAMTGYAESYDIAFIEGSCTRPSDEKRLASIRARASLVGTLGACAHIGGINAIRNNMGVEAAKKIVYGDAGGGFESYAVRPIGEVIKVDFVIPGCPIVPDEFLKVVTLLLQGRTPELPDYAVCIECKVRETPCAYSRGGACLGPITRAGCQAACPAGGYECVGCRGLITNPNLESMYQIMTEHGLSSESIQTRLGMFLTWEMQKRREKEIDRE